MCDGGDRITEHPCGDAGKGAGKGYQQGANINLICWILADHDAGRRCPLGRDEDGLIPGIEDLDPVRGVREAQIDSHHDDVIIDDLGQD